MAPKSILLMSGCQISVYLQKKHKVNCPFPDSRLATMHVITCSKGATTFSIATLGIMGSFFTLSIMAIYIECSYADCRYAECCYVLCRCAYLPQFPFT
jgi:hypothetical protein